MNNKTSHNGICPKVSQDFAMAESALEGDPEAIALVMEAVKSPDLTAALIARGASSTEAADIVGDLAGDCFGGERAKGSLHRLLGRYSGACPLQMYLRHIAINRLISLKRKRRLTISSDEEGFRERPALGGEAPGEVDLALIALIRDAVVKALARVDPQKLVLIRLIESYQIPQKQVGLLFGWHESKVSRTKGELLLELRAFVVEEVRKSDPWLHLEWEDFIALCGESSDLFGG